MSYVNIINNYLLFARVLLLFTWDRAELSLSLSFSRLLSPFLLLFCRSSPSSFLCSLQFFLPFCLLLLSHAFYLTCTRARACVLLYYAFKKIDCAINNLIIVCTILCIVCTASRKFGLGRSSYSLKASLALNVLKHNLILKLMKSN